MESPQPNPAPLWRLVELPIIPEPRGNLTYIEGQREVPFDIARVYYLYDVPGGATRAGHAHRELQQMLIAVSGSFTVHLDDGARTESVSLNRSYWALLISPMVWRVIDNFSSGAVCLSIVSHHFDEGDYYRDYDEFFAAAKALR
jgi:hypothetical protein